MHKPAPDPRRVLTTGRAMMVVAGLGIADLPDFIVGDAIAAGEVEVRDLFREAGTFPPPRDFQARAHEAAVVQRLGAADARTLKRILRSLIEHHAPGG